MIHASSVRWSLPIVLLLGGCIPGPRPEPAVPQFADAAVYATALEKVAEPGKVIVLVDSIIAPWGIDPTFPRPDQLPGGDRALFSAIGAAGREGRPLPRPLPTQREVRYIREPFGDRSDFGAVWEEFYARHPNSGGMFYLSAVGYDPGHTRAMVFVQHTCHSLCGTFWLVLLSRRPDGWTVDEARVIGSS